MTSSPGTPQRGVIWDLDGTLALFDVPLDRIRRWKRALTERLAPYGWVGRLSPMLPNLEAAISLAEGAGAGEGFRASIYRDLDDWEADALQGVSLLEANVRRACAWAAAGVPQAIVTNNGPTIAALGLQRIAEFARGESLADPEWISVVCRGPDVPAKPNPAGQLRAFEAISAAADVDRILVVGDAPSDWEAAEALAATIGVPVDVERVGVATP